MLYLYQITEQIFNLFKEIQAMIINKLPQILFTILGLVILWAALGASQDLTQTILNIIQ